VWILKDKVTLNRIDVSWIDWRSEDFNQPGKMKTENFDQLKNY
jgi:hypothetical protein